MLAAPLTERTTVTQDALTLYRTMLTAREVDRLEQEIVSRGEAHFHLSGAGHEGSACLAALLGPQDWLHCHYRSKALMLARGVTPQGFFDALYCTDASHSRGRQMSVHMCDARLKLLSIVGPVGNSALQAVGVAAEVVGRPDRPVVLCGLGDGTTQQGEFAEAVGEASRRGLPVLFFIEDNAWAISTPTDGKTFYSLGDHPPEAFLGVPIHHLDGTDPLDAGRRLAPLVEGMRRDRRPQIVVFRVDRLSNHTNADRQEVYRDAEDLERARREGDPILKLEAALLAAGHDPAALDAVRREVVAEVAAAEAAAALSPPPQATRTAARPLEPWLTSEASERRGAASGPATLTMRDALRETLRFRLASDPRVSLFGEDIEDPKGDVFGVTKTLSTQHPGRVQNSPLSESTILGVAVGRALAGGRPVAFLQFADFLPLAFNQIAAEMGAMHWRTDGQWESPVIVLAACGGYRPGLGPFHAQTGEALLAHTPGVDVLMPSNAADAAGMLNAAFASGRPTLILYPKALLNDPATATTADVADHLTPVGLARVVRPGSDITLVGWGNTVRICEQTADTLLTVGVEAEVIDLRSVSPWDREAVLASAEKTARLVVVHEDNHTCGLGAELLATVAAETRVPVAMRRVTRADTHVPCNFANQVEVLPSHDSVLEVAADLLDLDVHWRTIAVARGGLDTIDAVGSGPADETVVVVELHAGVGDRVARGDVVATLEATKSVFDLTARVAGTIREVHAAPGDTLAVGARMFGVETEPGARSQDSRPARRAELLPRRREPLAIPLKTAEVATRPVGLSFIHTAVGDRVVTNEELATAEGMTPEQVVRRTGIEKRRWLGKGQSAVSLAIQASRSLLEAERLDASELDLVVCSTTTPASVTPSTACLILDGLTEGDPAATRAQAYDLSAACSGYLFALQSAYDYLQSRPAARVLVVTAEALSPLINPQDDGTKFIFADAATATLVYGEAHMASAAARLLKPTLGGKADRDQALTVPGPGAGYITMNGRKVFAEAVQAMLGSLGRVCRDHGLGVGDLDLIVPHQANDRITAAVQRRVACEVFSNIREVGNTSSSSIPLALADTLPTLRPGARAGLCAFGGGFTFGAAILERLERQSQTLALKPRGLRRVQS